LAAFNFEAGSMSIIETTGNEVSGSYLVGDQPNRGVVSLDNSRLYISNFGSNNIAVYDIDLGKVIAYLPVVTHTDTLALSQNQNYLLVLDSGTGDLAVIQKRQLTRNSAIGVFVDDDHARWHAAQSDRGEVFRATGLTADGR
jgi:DNA-binding beta-propeller fold protein YncE